MNDNYDKEIIVRDTIRIIKMRYRWVRIVQDQYRWKLFNVK